MNKSLPNDFLNLDAFILDPYKPQYLVVMALKDESQQIFEKENIPVLYTGIGKINSTYALTRLLGELKQQNRNHIHVTQKDSDNNSDNKLNNIHIINFGTAGSFKLPQQSLVECSSFIQRDMDLTLAGAKLGKTPLDLAPSEIMAPIRLTQLPLAVCGTGDKIEKTPPKTPCDILDMEAYALAKVCLFEKINFTSIKFVTDHSNQNTHQDWKKNLNHAAQQFFKIYKELVS